MKETSQRALDILLIEPDQDTREALTGMLQCMGLKVLSVAKGTVALNALATTTPRLVVIELLLPGMDGFEVCQKIREEHDNDISILCMSGIKWGNVDLEELCKRRFGATFLKKPFKGQSFADVVSAILGHPEKLSEATEAVPPQQYGADGAKRLEDLSDEFESAVARVDTDKDRRQVRLEQAYCVEFENLGEFVKEYTSNISAGGLFIRCERLPEVDKIVDLTLQVPHVKQKISVRARVVHRVTRDQAEQEGSSPGFGVEFTDIDPQDRLHLKQLVADLRSLSTQDSRNTQSDSQSSPHSQQGPIWLLLVGMPAESLLRQPGFVHRTNVEAISFPNLEAAEDFVAVHSISVCVMTEKAIGSASAETTLQKLAHLIGENVPIIYVSSHPEAASLSASGLCDNVIRNDEDPEIIIEHLRQRLNIAQRKGPRIKVSTGVLAEFGEEEFQGHVINVSVGGMLLRTPHRCEEEMVLRLTFQLPKMPTIVCHGNVVRVQRDPGARELLAGVEFLDLDTDVECALRAFVQSQVNFREYFGWLKRSYFAGDDEGQKRESSHRFRNIFGLE